MSGQNTRKERVCTEKTLEIIKVFFGYSLETWSIEKNNVAMGKSNPKMIRENNSQKFYWARNNSCSCQRKYKISEVMGIKQSTQ